MTTETDDAAWMTDARCKGEDTNLFFPERGHPTEYAKALCRMCPVSEDCLNYALSHGERHGIWGGMGERSRRDPYLRGVPVVTRIGYCDQCGKRFTWQQKGNNTPSFCSDVCRVRRKNSQRLIEPQPKCVICGAAGFPSTNPPTCSSYCARVVDRRKHFPEVQLDEVG